MTCQCTLTRDCTPARGAFVTANTRNCCDPCGAAHLPDWDEIASRYNPLGETSRGKVDSSGTLHFGAGGAPVGGAHCCQCGECSQQYSVPIRNRARKHLCDQGERPGTGEYLVCANAIPEHQFERHIDTRDGRGDERGCAAVLHIREPGCRAAP